MSISILIGLWSEVSASRVFQVVCRASSSDMVEMSGEVGCWSRFVGCLVGVSVFSMVCLDAVIMSARSCPRWSVIGECHSP